MSHENVEVAQRWFDALGRGELGVEHWDPGLRIDNASGWPIEASYHGHEGLERWWDDLAEAFEDFRMEVEEIVPIDEERVLTSQRFVGHFRATGISFDGPWASVL